MNTGQVLYVKLVLTQYFTPLFVQDAQSLPGYSNVVSVCVQESIV